MGKKAFTRVSEPTAAQCRPYRAAWDDLTDDQHRDILSEHDFLAWRDMQAGKARAMSLRWSFDLRSEEERTTPDGCTTGAWDGHDETGTVVEPPNVWRRVSHEELERRAEVSRDTNLYEVRGHEPLRA